MADEDVIDVQSFTTQLQRELANNVTPELNKVTDISKDLNTAIIKGNIDVAIETLGSDKVKNLNTSLNASNAYFKKMKDETLIIARNLANAEAQGNLQAESQQIISNLSDRIEASTEKIKNREEEIIPKLQAKVQQAELQLSLMDLSDSNYESQKEKIKQLQDNLQLANNKTADMIGQQQALIHLKEHELKAVTDSLNANKATKDVLKDYIRVTSDIVSNSKEQLKTNENLKDVIDGMSDAQKKLLEESKDVIAEYLGGFDAIQESITGTIDKIPLIGGMINASIKKPLTEATDKAKTAFTTAFVKAKEVSLESGSSIKGMQAGLKEFASGLSGIGGLISKAFLGPLMLIGVFVGFISMAISELGRIEGAVRDMRKEFGALAQDVQPLRDIVVSVEQNLKGFGIGIEEAAASAGALRDVFADQATIQQDTVEFVAMLEEGMGIAASTGAGAIDMMMKMGAAGQKEASRVIMQTQKMSARFGVDFKKVMEDISSASEETMIFARGSAKALAEGAVQARRMGTSINDMAAAADRLLDFESSVNAEMKASTLFGRRINLNRLRGLALEGDAAGMAKEQLRIMQEMGGLRNMSRWQQNALAEAMGVELSTLYNLEKTRKQDLMLRQLAAEGDANAIAALQKRQAEEQKSNLSAKEQLKLQLQEQQTLENQKAIQDQFNKSMMQLKQALLPLAEKLMPKILSLVEMLTGEAGEVSGVMQGMITIVQILAKPFELILGLFSLFHGDASILKGMFSDTGTVLKSLAGLTIGWFLIFKKSIPLVGGLLKGLMGGLQMAGSKLAGMIRGGSAVQSMGPGAPGGGGPIKSATPKVSSPGGAGASRGMGAINAFNQIDMTKVLKGAAAMLVLSAALFVAAKAFQEFGKVTWDAVGKGIIVMGSMTFALIEMSKKLEKNMMNVLKGVGLIALLGIAIIPAAYAFQLFADVGWESVFTGIGAIALIAVVAGLMGAAFKFILIGAGVLVVLGLALIPFAYAAQMAAPAFETIADSFVRVAKSLSELTVGEIGKIALLGGMMVLFGGLSMFVIAGAAAFGFMALALIAVGKALEIASPGLTALGEFLTTGAEAFNTMIDGLVKLAETESGLFGAAAGIAAVGAAMAALGVGSGLGAAAGGLGNLIGAGFNKVGSLISGDESMNEDPMTKMLKLADAGPQLEQAAASLSKLTEISSMSDEIAESMGKIGESLSILVTTLIGFSLLGDDDPFESSFKSLEKIAGLSTRLNSLPNVASGLNLLLGNISKNASKIGGKSVNNLSVLGDSIAGMIKSIGDVDAGQIAKLPQLSDGINLVVDVSARLTDLNISEDIDDVFMGIGNGLEELSKYLDDDEIADLLKLNKLQNLEGTVGVMLDLSSVDFTNIASSFQLFAKSISVLAESVNKLDIQKLKELNKLPSSIGNQGPLGDTGPTGPASNVITGTIVSPMIAPEPNSLEAFFYESGTGPQPVGEEVQQSLRRQVQIQQNQGGIPRIDVPVGPIKVEPPTKYDINMDNVDPISQMKPNFTESEYKKFVERLQINDSDINLSTIEDLQYLMQSRQSDIDNPDFDIHTLGSIKMSVNQVAMYKKLIAELEAKVSEKFKALGETKMNLPTTNVFDWTQDASGNVDFGPPSSMQTNVGQTATFNPFDSIDPTLPPADPFTEGPTKSLSEVFSSPLESSVNNTIPTTSTDTINPDATGMTIADKLMSIFNALNCFTSESFIGGMARATISINTFANALTGFTDENIRVMDKILAITGFRETDEQTTPMSVIPEERLSTTNEPVVNINVPTQPTDSELNNNTEVVKKLNELITLMKNGGISVNMDGRKVSKAISTRED